MEMGEMDRTVARTLRTLAALATAGLAVPHGSSSGAGGAGESEGAAGTELRDGALTGEGVTRAARGAGSLASLAGLAKARARLDAVDRMNECGDAGAHFRAGLGLPATSLAAAALGGGGSGGATGLAFEVTCRGEGATAAARGADSGAWTGDLSEDTSFGNGTRMVGKTFSADTWCSVFVETRSAPDFNKLFFAFKFRT